MPLVAHSPLPTFNRLKQEGQTVLSDRFALQQDIRAMHIGLLNMMPDKALAATERQFFRLIGESNQIAQFYVHPFTLDALPRGAEAQAYIEKYYEPWAAIQDQGLDALIITGANVTQPDLSLEAFWQPLIEVIDWAYDNVTSSLCSCLATHAVMQFRYGQTRRALGHKCWGVFPHYVVDRTHPLVNGVNTRFDVPHSRFNDISRDQFDAAGVKVLVESEEAGVHLAVSEDQFRLVFFQGHPEYDIISLLKEYKREVARFAAGEREDYPSMVAHYFSQRSQAILEEYRLALIDARETGRSSPAFPEELISAALDNTWHDTAEAVINNWIGHVYQLTHVDRKKPFREGLDPNNPLGRLNLD